MKNQGQRRWSPAGPEDDGFGQPGSVCLDSLADSQRCVQKPRRVERRREDDEWAGPDIGRRARAARDDALPTDDVGGNHAGESPMRNSEACRQVGLWSDFGKASYIQSEAGPQENGHRRSFGFVRRIGRCGPGPGQGGDDERDENDVSGGRDGHRRLRKWALRKRRERRRF